VLTLSETIENFLGCRTSVLGGLGKVDVSSESFDTFFLSEGGTEWHRNFLKATRALAEKGSAIGAPIPMRQAVEHDVH